jgi:hypothetical protein
MSDLFEELDGDEEMVTPAQIGLMLVDWTDPSKTVCAKLETADSEIVLIRSTPVERRHTHQTNQCTSMSLLTLFAHCLIRI